MNHYITFTDTLILYIQIYSDYIILFQLVVLHDYIISLFVNELYRSYRCVCLNLTIPFQELLIAELFHANIPRSRYVSKV